MIYLLNLPQISASLMSNSYFRFKQFTVRHDRCAMKVGTDGVLLGAWAHVDGCERILDVGCGTGLLSLMAAQRNRDAHVCGIDVQKDAILQARENVLASPFSERIEITEVDVRNFVGNFDCILCNPPFFTEDTSSANRGRAIARSTSSLSYDELCQAAERLLAEDGYFNVVIPFREQTNFCASAISCGFVLYRRLSVRTVERKEPKRLLVTFRKGTYELKEDWEIVLQNPDGSRSSAYCSLTGDFYLSPAQQSE